MVQNPETRKLVFFFAGMFLLALVLIAGASFALKFISRSEPAIPPAPPLEIPADRGSATTKIIDASRSIDSRPVRYTDGGFAPTEITITALDAVGCLVTIENKTKNPLKVGVSPHRESGDPGANYRVIAPGESGVLDPRYPGLSQVSLHNHAVPIDGFRVTYGEGCK